MLNRVISSYPLVAALASCVLLIAGCDTKRKDPVSPQQPATRLASAETAQRQLAETGPDDSGEARLPVKDGEGTAVGTRGAVTSAEANASQVGLDVLQRGGNAVDAAVALAFALGVTHPSAANIGGGGFMVIRFPDGRSTAIDYRETAPGKAHRDMYLDKQGNVTRDSRTGPRAAGIPGTVAGLALVHAKYGSLPWKELIMPAVKLARDGAALDESHATGLKWGLKRIVPLAEDAAAKDPNSPLAAAYAATVATFRRPDGTNYQAGEVWKQPALAKTLQAIADGGRDAFYRGPLAREMVEKVNAMGGIWTVEDLASYRVVVREPLVFDYRGHQVITMPPPSAGGLVLRHILAASEVLGLPALAWDSPDRIHLFVEASRRIHADRNSLLGDPAFVKIPMERLLDMRYMEQRMADVNRVRATPSSEIGSGIPVKESAQTTHFCVFDKNGIAVSNTYTLNGGFGAKVQIPDTGITLNNEMDDFTAKVGAANMFGLVQGAHNAIEPGKRMLSSMTPTIVVKDGKLRVMLGSPGGPVIPTAIAQVIMQLIDHDRTLGVAVAAPRVHHQWLPDAIWHEPLPETTVKSLSNRGHAMRERGRMGHITGIEVDPKTGGLRAVADVARRGGKAVAY